ncbi:TSC22 domain family protein 4 [Strigops habroptila]|uniref:TSC22 domain family member 4 n=1 Tax=Strigops habroptila TaxID=2489341 RepID=A0A672ULP7_STRHB|nr:TSC22 domain family protein 4 [Strigops habroptila]
MSRKKSGFAITSVRGGAGGAMEPAAGSSSRFRLIRFPAPAEPSRRGRWVCRDSYERGGGGRVVLSLGSPLPRPFPADPPRSLGAFAELVQALPPSPPEPRPGGGPALSARWGLAAEDDEEEGAGSGVTAIDNKIEQAMDLVKSHLLLAVREEVELLREQLKELRERRAALERENGLLRALATPQQLARLRGGPAPP